MDNLFSLQFSFPKYYVIVFVIIIETIVATIEKNLQFHLSFIEHFLNISFEHWCVYRQSYLSWLGNKALIRWSCKWKSIVVNAEPDCGGTHVTRPCLTLRKKWQIFIEGFRVSFTKEVPFELGWEEKQCKTILSLGVKGTY